MFGSSKRVDVSFYLGRLRHEIPLDEISRADQVNFQLVAHYAKLIMDFIDEYLHKHHRVAHPSRKSALHEIHKYLQYMIDSANRRELGTGAPAHGGLRYCRIELEKKLAEYTGMHGSVYLLRHPDKSSEKGRNLSFMGVKQAKEVAELIEDEILMSPIPVKLIIHRSEFRRTWLFNEIIKRVHKAQLMEKSVSLHEEEDHRLFMGPLGPEVHAILGKMQEQYGKDNAMFMTYKAWVQKKDGFEDAIKKRAILNPDTVKSDVESFVLFARKKIRESKDHYTIVLGISHSWILDTFLIPFIGVDELINTAEFAKIESNHLFYKGTWKELPHIV